MVIKAVFFDIDGTLLTDNRTVRQSTISAINSLKKIGVLVGLATGRDPRFVLKYMASLGLDLAITYNGQYIFSRDTVLHEQELVTSDVKAIIEYAKAHKKDVALGRATGYVGSSIPNMGMGNFSYMVTRFVPKCWTGSINFIFNRLFRKVSPQTKEELHALLGQPIYQMLILSTEREMKKLQGTFPNLSFTRSSSYATDVISKGMSKLEGIKLVAAHYGFGLDQVMVFGDSNNDVEMLCGIPHSVAMGNATRKAKKSAAYVTTSNNKDGILQAIQYFGVLEGEGSHFS
ncbi:Cof-type HAD-IIB family hydrolase [Streptococcus sp. X16XC17]|nr:Cof-type HAD-IIB family hydrolase [Streptococcus sp. X16XC17]